MNLEESDSFREEIESNTRKRRGVMLSIVLCAILVALLFFLIIMIKHKDAITEKMFLNDKQIALTPTIYKQVGEDLYISVPELAELLGYEYKKGNYGLYDEDEESCYMTNKFEILSISSNSDKFVKYIDVAPDASLAEIVVTQESPSGYSESFKLAKPIKIIDGTIYAPYENIEDMFNLVIDWGEYRKRIYDLNYIVADTKAILGNLGITEISGYYENLRAMMYGYIIKGNGTDGNQGDAYGVFSQEKNKDILTLQYKNIKFAQNAREFYITTDNGKMGLLDKDGNTIIKASEYDEVSLLDEENQLYLVKKDGEYGVLNRNGKVVVYVENDEVGYDVSDFELDNIENSMLFFGNCIPVEKNKKYGLYNTLGDVVLGISYDGFGYKSTASSRTSGNEESVLTIPRELGIEGIVINQDDLYGIYDVNEEKIILPCVFTKIYAVRKSGQITYYAEYDGTTCNLKEYLRDNNLVNIDTTEKDKKEDSNSDFENEVDETNTNTVVESENEVQPEEVIE